MESEETITWNTEPMTAPECVRLLLLFEKNRICLARTKKGY